MKHKVMARAKGIVSSCTVVDCEKALPGMLQLSEVYCLQGENGYINGKEIC